MRVICVRNADRKSIIKQLFGHRHFKRIVSTKHGIVRQTECALDYETIMGMLRKPDDRLYKLVGDAFETESLPYIDNSDTIICVDRLVNAPLEQKSVIIWPLERFADLLARSLHHYVTYGGIVPAIHYYMDWLITDQNLLADIIKESKHKVILYDTASDKIVDNWIEACIYSSKLHSIVSPF